MSLSSIEPKPTSIEPSPAARSLRPRRTLHRLALALAALALAAGGQVLFSQDAVRDGLLLYGIAAVLFISALAQHPYRLVSPGQAPAAGLSPGSLATLAGGWRRNVGTWLLLLAAGTSYLSFTYFASQDTYLPAWWLYLGSLILLLSGGLVLTRDVPGGWRANRSILRGLLLIIGLALVLRVYRFDTLPFGIWYDEAEAGLQARQMLQVPDYRPVFYPPINITGHLLAIYALALDWLGNNIQSMRLVSALFGVGGVVAAYLFGRELRGPRFGLALAFLLAVARWSINFSRIAMTGIDTPFFEFLSLFFLVRMLRRDSLRDALWAGLALGGGLLFYTAFRLYLVGLVIFAGVALVLWWPEIQASLRGCGWQAYLARFIILGLSTWLVIMPVIKFALDNSDAFWYRTQQISIFTRRDQPDLNQALLTSAGKHLLMFNYKGDTNGRHNLPGRPMLDPLTGILAVLGLALALARPRYPANTLFLILLPLTLAGGIFSVDFEAPQSLRSIAVMPVIIYFAGMALVALGREAEAALRPLPRTWLYGPAAALAGYVLIANAGTYFIDQANDFASWNAFSAAETITGRKMAELGPNYIYYLSPFLTSHPTVRFLAPAAVDHRPIPLPDALPIREPPDRPVAIFLHPDDERVFEQARRIYPNGTFEVASGEIEGAPPVVYFVGLQPADLAAVQGVELRYRPGLAEGWPDETALPLYVSRVPAVNTTWAAQRPPELANARLEGDNVVGEWSGVLYAPRYGPYSFRLATPGRGLLEIDGNTVLEGTGEQLTGLPLAQGNHSFRVMAQVQPGRVNLMWQPPGQGETPVPTWALYNPPITNNGLLGTFYANDQWAGQPAFQRIDPYLDIYFHLTPLNRPYTAEWSGSLDVPRSGIYRLGLRAVPGAELYLEGKLALTTIIPNEYVDTALTLEAGLHDIRVRFRDNADRSRIHLYWIPPGGSVEPIPSERLWPPLGRYPPRPALTETAPPVLPLTLNWVMSLGQPGAEPGQYLEPRDVAVLPDGNLAVADTVNRRVQLLSPQGTPLKVITGDPYPFEEPLAVSVNSRHELLVLDSTLQWVYRFNAAGELIDRFGGPPAYLFHPRGMTVFEDDTVALADTGGARLALFNADGIQAGSIGGLGSGPGQFNEPTDVLRDALGTYFVAEAENDRIQRVDPNGNPISQWAIPPAYAFNGPHMAFGPDGTIFMTEAQSRLLLRYASDGTLLDQWQTIGPVSFAAPVGLHFDANTNLLYVTDVRQHQIHVFSVRASGTE